MATALTGKAVWSTAAINDLPDSSFLYVESGGEKDDDGKTTPRSLRHFPYKDASGKVDLPHLRNAIARIPQSNAPGLNKSALQSRARSILAKNGGGSSDSEKAGRRMQGGMLQKLRDVLRWAAYEDEEDEGMEEEDEEDEGEDMMETKGFSVIKTEDGTYRWVAVSSSAFVDREGEIVSTKALTDDVARADKTGQRGPLLLWHVPGTDIGDCDFQAVEGRLLVESGTFHDNEFATTVRKALERSEEPLGVSIGFRHTLDQPDADGVFHRIVIHERSVCPLEVAANPFTSFETLKEEPSVMDEKRKAWFQSLVGPAHADRIVGVASAKSKELEGLYSFKALDALKAEPEEPPEPPEEPPDDDDGGDDGGEEEKALALKAGEFFEAIAETVNEALSPAVEAVKAQDLLLSAMVEEIKSLRSRLDKLEAVEEKTATPAPTQTKASRAREALAARPTESDGNIVDSGIVREMFKAAGKDPSPPQDDNPVRPYIDDIFNGALSRGA